MAFIATSAGPKPYNPHPVHRSDIKTHNFSPYEWNGGVIVSIVGKDFAVLGCDTRLAEGYNILSRDVDRTFELSSKTVIGCGGCHADVIAFYNVLKYKSTMYHFKHKKEMSTEASAQLVCNTLYQKRFFPYYCVPVVCGLDKDGVGYCTNYDVIGSYVRSKDPYTCNGGSSALVMPILDNLLGTKGVTSGHLEEDPDKPGRRRKKHIDMTVDEAIEIMKQVFIGVAERDILSGDKVIIKSVTSAGIKTEDFELRKD